MRFVGTYTALITPFSNGKLDTNAYRQLIDKQIASGVDGIVPVGTTGESPTLTTEEHTEVVRLTVEAVRGAVRVIAGTGSNSTAEAVHLTQEAEKLGADAALLVAPYYNKPSQEGLYRHYQEISRSTSLPLILYSIPGRCGVEISVETVARLASDCPNIVALKEAGGSVERVSQLRTAVPSQFSILSGDDSLTLPFLAVGAQGVISVASNVIPQEISQLVKAWQAGQPEVALQLHLKYYDFFKSLFVEANPAPVKYALSLLDKSRPEVRLPLCELSGSSKQRIEHALRHVQLLPLTK
ncbi:MAG: 4-hydroxy-tetrahydrodipicolinate synthase [Verrucomicrobia bacterium]|nr:MAG: 4-hydroxy-tetrahydrodipicolinate synthase [Verrucomicrobiota bacterium]